MAYELYLNNAVIKTRKKESRECGKMETADLLEVVR